MGRLLLTGLLCRGLGALLPQYRSVPIFLVRFQVFEHFAQVLLNCTEAQVPLWFLDPTSASTVSKELCRYRLCLQSTQ